MLVADRLVKAAGLSWSAILAGQGSAQATLEPPQPHRPHQGPAPPPASPQARAARMLAEGGDRLTAWQAGFCRNLARWAGRVSDKQVAILGDIEAKAARQAA